MEVVKFLIQAIFVLILITALLIVLVGSLWVLRVILDWWLDLDYVVAIRDLLKNNKSLSEIAKDIKQRKVNIKNEEEV